MIILTVLIISRATSNKNVFATILHFSIYFEMSLNFISLNKIDKYVTYARPNVLDILNEHK